MVVNVIMTTYFPEAVPERQDYARDSLKSLLTNLYCEDGLRLIVSDDTDTPKEVCNDLIHMAELATYPQWNGTTYSCSGHRGIGASLNKSLTKVPTENGYFMYTCDDWRLEAPLNLDGPLTLLRKLDYDVVRLGPIHPDLNCTTRFQVGLGYWLDLHQHYGGFAFATRPFIATKKFYDKIGPFDEGLNSYEVERLYAERVAKSTCKLAYWGSVNLNGPFMHIGEACVGYMDVS